MNDTESVWGTEEDIPPEVRAVLEGLIKVARGELDVCPRCGTKLTGMEQIGRCVYGSCGCRMYQGFVPDKWRQP